MTDQTQLLRTMLGSVSQGIFMIGEDGRISAFNPQVCLLLNLAESYLASRPSLQEITRFQLHRGDFGDQAGLVDANARDYVASAGSKPFPDKYLRRTQGGRVLEVKTQPLPGGAMVRTFTDVTDYVAAQSALERSSQLLAATQSMAGVGGWEMDAVTGAVYWTEGIYQMLETTPAQFVPDQDNVLSFFEPASQALMRSAMHDALVHGIAHDLVLQMRTAKGRAITVHCKNTLTLEQGRVLKSLAVLRDITADREADAALRASEELLRQVTAQVPGAVYRVHTANDGRRHYSFVSPGVQKLLGITPEQVLADPDLLPGLIYVEDRERCQREIAVAVANDSPIANEYRILSRDGGTKWIQMISSLDVRDAEGVARVGVLIDITDRKAAEAALRERDELWKLALESSGDGVWDWYIQTGVELYSRRILEMYGFAEGELSDAADELDRRTHPDDVEEMLRARQAHFDGLTPSYVNEHRIQCKDGSWKWVMSRGMVISRDALGRPLRMTGIHTDITGRKQSEALIWQQANFDALTGLPNRRMLRDRLAQDIRKSRRDSQQLALLFIDLDHFKEINDTLGHHQGDALLVEAAARICHCVHGGDTVARMGGDEFTVVLPGLADAAKVEPVVQQILLALATVFQLGQDQAFVSASIGITLFPGDADDIDGLFKHADQALYAAKGAGRNRFSYFTPALQDAAQTRARLTLDLRHALADQQLWLAYQPIVDLKTGLVHKAEALLRWQHPQHGLISPAEFIPIAESSGLILEIGDWVFRQAAQQVAQWRQTLHPQFQVSVNKSPVQFHNAQLSQQAWFDFMRSLGLPGDGIVVEITEGLLLDDNPAVNAQLLALRDAGVGVSLDDFGTGYSSLSYLQQYDIDYVKIDQSFVRRLSPISKDLALCKAIISMAHELGMRVIAEGVETGSQRDLLTAAGCDYGQGYLFSRPVAADVFARNWTDAQATALDDHAL